MASAVPAMARRVPPVAGYAPGAAGRPGRGWGYDRGAATGTGVQSRPRAVGTQRAAKNKGEGPSRLLATLNV